MGSAERRERERQEVRAKILDAARDLFVAEGYEAVTMRKIAEKIEYSPTAIYLHFRDKDALIQEMAAADFQVFNAQFQRIAKVADPVERLRKAGRVYVEFGLSHPNHYRLMFTVARPASVTPDTMPKDPKGDGYFFLRSTITACIEAGRLRPELEDPDLVAQAVWTGVHGLVSLLLIRPGDPWISWRKPKDIVNVALEVLITGLVRQG
jgi:AcrR family transcriptional regulator